MTPSKAKKIVKEFLLKESLSFKKLVARTIDFTDLARDECIFVEVRGWTPSPKANNLIRLAKENGFRVTL